MSVDRPRLSFLFDSVVKFKIVKRLHLYILKWRAGGFSSIAAFAFVTITKYDSKTARASGRMFVLLVFAQVLKFEKSIAKM